MCITCISIYIHNVAFHNALLKNEASNQWAVHLLAENVVFSLEDMIVNSYNDYNNLYGIRDLIIEGPYLTQLLVDILTFQEHKRVFFHIS